MKTIGVIGLGSIGMRHARNLISMGHDVVGFDPVLSTPEVGKFMQANNIEALIEDSDAVIIASPTDQHYNHILDCVAELKPFLVEKPIIGANTEKEKVIALDFYFKRIPHMVGYNLRFHSCVKKAKEWLSEGFLGKPLWANFTLSQYSEKPPYLRDGVILNWSHEIDLCLYLLGEAEISTSATRVTGGKDDMTDILLHHENGCRSTVHLDYLTKPEIRQGIIVGTKATIIFDLVNRQAWLRDAHDPNSILEHFQGADTWNDNYIDEMRAFIDRIDGKETLGCTAEEALKVLDICLEVRRRAGLS